MATVDLNYVQFWAPPSNPFLYKQRPTSSQSTGRSIYTNSSRNQLAPLHKSDRIFKRNDQSKSAITAARHQGDDFATGAQGIAGRNNDSTNRDDELDDGLPPIEEILGQISRRGILIGGDQNAKAALQDLDKPALDTNRNRIGPKQSRLDNGVGDSQGTRDRPLVIDDDEPDSTDDEDEDEDEAEATRGGADPSSAQQDANPYSALLTQDTDPELCKPIVPSGPERWYDVEAGCYVDEEPLPGLEPEGQEGSAASTLAHDHSHPLHQTGQHDNDRNTQSTLEEPAPHSLPKPLDEDGGGGSGENISDLERDMLLAFEEQEKSSSATALSSPQPPCRYTEQSSPQIDQEGDQGYTSHGRLNELGYGSPLREQDHIEEELQEQQPQQQQQEVAVQAMREDDNDYGDDDDDDDGEQRGEKRRHQDEIEQIRTNVYHSKNSGHSHDTSSEDEDPRPAKRRKFRLRRPRSLTPPLATQVEINDAQSHADHGCLPDRIPGDHLQSNKAPNPTSAGDEESTSNVSAEYQEWPMRGVFKRVIVGDEVRYGMEFSLEEPHGLTRPQHTVAHDSTDGTLWEIRRITGMRKVDGVQEFRVAWAQTWMPESELGGARELVDEFKARLSVRHGKKNGQGKTDVMGSNASFSARPSRRAQPFSACAPSRSKRPRFTEEEDARLVNLKERRDWSWEDIQRSFPGRSTGSLQVRYSTKLKERNTAS